MMPLGDLAKFNAEFVKDCINEWINREEEVTSFYCAIPFDYGYSDSPRKSKRKEFLDAGEIETLARCVRQVLTRRNSLILNDFTDDDKNEIIAELNASYNLKVSITDWDDILKVAKLLSAKKKYEINVDSVSYRPASLNCFDYERLTQEFKALEKIVGSRNLELYCGCLVKIMTEAKKQSEKNPLYPGRRKDISHLVGKTAVRYQRLRLMDQILATAEEALSDDDMKEALRIEAKRLRSDPDRIATTDLEKDYTILKTLISVEYDHGNRRGYKRDVFEFKRRGYRIYEKFQPDGDRRLCAFAFEISFDEALSLRREIESIKTRFFQGNDRFFDYNFPVLSFIWKMRDIVDSLSDQLSDEESRPYTKVKYTDVGVFTYLPPIAPEIREKVERMIELKLPIACKTNDSLELMTPLYIKEHGDKWVLVAKRPDNSQLRLLTPHQLQESFFSGSSTTDSINHSDESLVINNIIGITPLLKSHPCDVVLTLTRYGILNFESISPNLLELKPKLEIYSRQVSFKVYPNDDFFDEIYQIDKRGYLENIDNEEVFQMYKDYYERTQNSPWIPKEDRSPSLHGRLRDKRES